MTMNEEENLNSGTKAPHALIDIINPNILAIKLHVNGLTVVMKRQRLSYGFLKKISGDI